jgi:hypothetical protein
MAPKVSATDETGENQAEVVSPTPSSSDHTKRVVDNMPEAAKATVDESRIFTFYRLG